MSSEVSSRPTAEWILVQSALLWAQRSTCSRAQVGAVIAIQGRQVSSGYNGAPAGMPHCNHDCDCGYPGEGGLLFEGKHLSNCASLPEACVSVHAEANAIAFAARHGVALEGATLYTTYSPCVSCAQLIINSGITKVVYLNDYRLTNGRKLLEQVGIETHQM